MPPASRWSGPDGPVPPWPYGRPGINFANVGLSFVLGLSSTDSVGRFWPDQTGVPAEDVSWSKLGISVSADVRVRPSWMVGLLVSIARTEAESSSDKLIANRGRYFTPHGIRELVNSQQVWVGPRRP